jgi:protein-S-isoprenylcysteine O-methyltransferase Ste14
MSKSFVRFAECTFLILLSLGVILRLAPQLAAHPQLALFLVSEMVGVTLILLQRRGDAATAIYPVTLAFVGTGASLCVAPQGTDLVSNTISTVLVFSGAAVALGAKLSLRRSFGIVPANRGVKRGGLYRFVRHPMYFGYIVSQLGFLLLYFGPWNIAVYAVSWTALWLRAVEEEKFLSADPAYREYSSQVRARLVPGLV